LIASYDKQTSINFAAKNAIFHLTESKNFANFIKIRQKSIFSSRPPVFIILSFFYQKRNFLEPTYYQCTFVCLD